MATCRSFGLPSNIARLLPDCVCVCVCFGFMDGFGWFSLLVHCHLRWNGVWPRSSNLLSLSGLCKGLRRSFSVNKIVGLFYLFGISMAFILHFSITISEAPPVVAGHVVDPGMPPELAAPRPFSGHQVGPPMPHPMHQHPPVHPPCGPGPSYAAPGSFLLCIKSAKDLYDVDAYLGKKQMVRQCSPAKRASKVAHVLRI